MERMNDDIPFEHQMMFIIRDYDRKVEENMELRKEVEELSAALEKQGVQLHDAKVDLKNEIKDTSDSLMIDVINGTIDIFKYFNQNIKL